MNCDKRTLIGFGFLMSAGLCAVLAEGVKSPWLVGKRYETTVKYDIVMENVRIKPTDKYGYFETSELTMRPAYHYVTDNITTNGVNWWAFRRYDECQNTIEGLDVKKWKTKGLWNKVVSLWDRYVPPRKYVELKDCRAEKFFNVFDDDSNAQTFDAGNSHLLVSWNEPSLYGENASPIRVWDIPNSDIRKLGYSDAAKKYRERGAFRSQKVAEAIQSEMKLYGSTMFETEVVAFEDILKAKDGKRFRLDVAKLHGLLMPAIKKMVEFKGDVWVEKTALKPSETRGKFENNLFDGMKLTVVQSENLEVRYRRELDEELRGNDYSVEIPNAQMPSDTIELWFDSRHGFLRYALVQLTIPDYEGDIPNPKLGKVLKDIHGQISGNLVFRCEYFTDVGDVMTEDKE